MLEGSWRDVAERSGKLILSFFPAGIGKSGQGNSGAFCSGYTIPPQPICHTDAFLPGNRRQNVQQSLVLCDDTIDANFVNDQLNGSQAAKNRARTQTTPCPR
jgi:hypothetical protein